ncbi:MAG: hypothetical protein K2M47_05385 [Clostridiales bacterium]|nr:hypothetical protein [Clostridiales bacterium]
MNIETKEVNGNISSAGEWRSFGWQQTASRKVRSGRSRHRTIYTLARDKDMPNYAALNRMEGEYLDLKRNKKTYNPMEASNVLIAFAFLIIPGIIYVTVKLKQKKRINEHNADVQKQMDAVIAKAQQLL